MNKMTTKYLLRPLLAGLVLAILPLVQANASVLPAVFDPTDVLTYHDTNSNEQQRHF